MVHWDPFGGYNWRGGRGLGRGRKTPTPASVVLDAAPGESEKNRDNEKTDDHAREQLHVTTPRATEPHPARRESPAGLGGVG